GGALAPERSPADLEGAEAALAGGVDVVDHRAVQVHQQRGVGSDALAVAPAEQPPDWLAGRLAEDVPEGDVDTADRVGERAAAAEPEGVLVELLADALGLEGALVPPERL